MNHKINGEYGRGILTPLTLEESEWMRILRNQNKQWFIYSEEITQEEQKKWYQNYLCKPDDIMFSVYHKGSGKWIGAVALYNIDVINNQAEFGRIVVDGESVHKRGLGLDTTICACQIGFKQLGISKIKLEVYSNNIAAKKTYEKAGFSVIGIQKIEEGRKMISMELNNVSK